MRDSNHFYSAQGDETHHSFVKQGAIDFKQRVEHLVASGTDQDLLANTLKQWAKFETVNRTELLELVTSKQLAATDLRCHQLRLTAESLLEPFQVGRYQGIDFDALGKLISHLARMRSRLIDNFFGPAFCNQSRWTVLDVLRTFACFANSWQGDVEQWRPRSLNRERQLMSLLHHLLDPDGRAPQFLSSRFTIEPAATCRLFTLLRGDRDALPTLQVWAPGYTRKMLHFFLNAPKIFSLDEAICYGHVLGVGGDRDLVEKLLKTRLRDRFIHLEFWSTVVRWLVKNPQFSSPQIGEIIRYIRFQRFGLGDSDCDDPYWAPFAPKPNFRMEGRLPVVLYREAKEWSCDLTSQSMTPGKWQKQNIAPYHAIEATEANETQWTIRELNNYNDLRRQAKLMKNCVNAYARLCANQVVSIWSVEKKFAGEKAIPVATIELGSDRVIYQVKGAENAPLTQDVTDQVTKWAQSEQLKFNLGSDSRELGLSQLSRYH